jgi:hypothetical protein
MPEGVRKRGSESQKSDISFFLQKEKVTKETLFEHMPMTLTPMTPYDDGRENHFFMT